MTRFDGAMSPAFEIVEPAQWRAPVIFNSPQAKALFADPVSSPSSRRIAEIEYAYWQRVLREDPTSGGGRLGSAFPARRPSPKCWCCAAKEKCEPRSTNRGH